MKHSYSYVAMPLMFELPSDEFKLLAILVNQANIYQSNTFFKQAKELMSILGIKDIHTYSVLIKDLKNRGLIEIKRNFNKPNTFTINFDNFPNQIKKDEEKTENGLTDTSTQYCEKTTQLCTDTSTQYCEKTTQLCTDTSDTVGSIQDHPTGTSTQYCEKTTQLCTDTSDSSVKKPQYSSVKKPQSNKETKNIDITILNSTRENEYSTREDKVKLIKKDYLNQFNDYVEKNSKMSREEFDEYRNGWFLKLITELNEYLTDEEFDKTVQRVDFYTENLYSQMCLSA